MTTRPLVAPILLALCAPASRAGLVALVPASADNTLYETANGSLSNGAGVAMFAGRNSQTSLSRRRALIRFDLATALPSGATITSATLRLYQESANTEPRDVSLHRVVEPWGEGTSSAIGAGGGGAPSTPGDATWIHALFPTANWSTPGGTFLAAPSAVTSVGGTDFWEWSSPDLLADVQFFFSSPSLNFGWLLRGDESASSTAKRFFTREADPEFRPVLILAYVPGPAAAPPLLALALVAALRRRG